MGAEPRATIRCVAAAHSQAEQGLKDTLTGLVEMRARAYRGCTVGGTTLKNYVESGPLPAGWARYRPCIDLRGTHGRWQGLCAVGLARRTDGSVGRVRFAIAVCSAGVYIRGRVGGGYT